MDVIEALKKRKSTRAFLSRPVNDDVIKRILTAAKHAPSGANTQPWQVAVVTGSTKRQVEQRLEQTFRDGEEEAMDYQYYSKRWPEPYRSRRVNCGRQLYNALGIDRKDRERRADQWAANYRAFDAPMVLFFFMDSTLATGSFIDYGMFLQSIMVAAVAEGLATCPQVALAMYPHIVKKTLGYPADTILVCGMAMGYEDPTAKINKYRVPREGSDTFTRFFT